MCFTSGMFPLNYNMFDIWTFLAFLCDDKLGQASVSVPADVWCSIRQNKTQSDRFNPFIVQRENIEIFFRSARDLEMPAGLPLPLWSPWFASSTFASRCFDEAGNSSQHILPHLRFSCLQFHKSVYCWLNFQLISCSLFFLQEVPAMPH